MQLALFLSLSLSLFLSLPPSLPPSSQTPPMDIGGEQETQDCTLAKLLQFGSWSHW